MAAADSKEVKRVITTLDDLRAFLKPLREPAEAAKVAITALYNKYRKQLGITTPPTLYIIFDYSKVGSIGLIVSYESTDNAAIATASAYSPLGEMSVKFEVDDSPNVDWHKMQCPRPVTLLQPQQSQ